jgi:hypothetical protein
MRNLEMSPTNQSRKASNARPVDRKRRASSSSVSSVSSVSSLEDLSEEADSSEEDADDEEEPAVRAPSYGRRRHNKAGRQPANTKRRRVMSDDDTSDSSDANDSDDSSDDVYAAVDYITDAEDEEQDVEKMEEMMIMESEKTHRPLSSTGFADDQWAITSFDDHMFLPAASFFDEEHLYSAMDTFGEPEVTSEAVETPVARRVHFEERSDSSSDSDSHSDDEIIGDFLQQDSLDPQLRRMIESDNGNFQRGHRRHSEEVFGDADYGHGSIYHVESDGGSSEGSLSGYESMQIGHSCCVQVLLTLRKAMMVTPQTRIFPHQRQSPTLDPSSAGALPTLWPPLMRRMTVFRAAVDLSWEPSWQTPTNQWLWSTALASIS